MKRIFPGPGRCAAFTGKLLLMIWLGLRAGSAWCQETTATPTNNPEADKAWREVYKASQPPFPPAAWQTNQPSREEVAKFNIAALLKGADLAKIFYTKYPAHPKAAQAHKKEYELLNIAAQQFGDSSQTARLAALEAERLNDPKLGEDERFKLRLGQTQRLLSGLPATQDELLKSADALQKDFPKREEVYRLMMSAAAEAEGAQAKVLLQMIVDGPAPDDVKTMAKGMLERQDALGKPVAIQFTALDGRAVDIAQLKGKVVLIDFWATWCGPCVGEVPHVKETYEKLHDKGFEIVGLSFDESKDALETFVKEKGMAWPQYFDGKGWQNKFGQQFGINSIPTMWLVDKQGNLRDMNARDGLEERVAKLLAE